MVYCQLGQISADLIFPPILPAIGDEVDQSFVKGDAADSNFEVDMPTKAKNLGDALASKKSKAIATPAI